MRERGAVCAYHASRGSVRVMVTVPCVLKLQSRWRRVVGSRDRLMVVPTAMVVWGWGRNCNGTSLGVALTRGWRGCRRLTWANQRHTYITSGGGARQRVGGWGVAACNKAKSTHSGLEQGVGCALGAQREVHRQHLGQHRTGSGAHVLKGTHTSAHECADANDTRHSHSHIHPPMHTNKTDTPSRPHKHTHSH